MIQTSLFWHLHYLPFEHGSAGKYLNQIIIASNKECCKAAQIKFANKTNSLNKDKFSIFFFLSSKH